jgi:hypothetical protein
VFENRVLRRILGWKRDEMARVWRKVYRLMIRKLEGKRPLGRPRHRWVDNIKMDLGEIACGGADWIGLAQDRDRW